MKIAVMQPYLFPYIGYFQLIHSVDLFVLYDDVQFIRRGWINRNRMLNQSTDYLFTLPLTKAPRNSLICERKINADTWHREKPKLLAMIERNYMKAPHFSSGIKTITAGFEYKETNLVDFIEHTLEQCCSLLNIETPMRRASQLELDPQVQGAERILQICKALGANHYINAIGGQEIYDRPTFKREGIDLSFIKTHNIHYPQFGNEFVPWLSIIDIMMFNPVDRIREFLDMYELV